MQLTFQTRLDHLLTDTQAQQIHDLLVQSGKFFRTVFNAGFFNPKTNFNEFKKKAVCEQFRIGTKLANGLIIDAKSKIRLHQENIAFFQKEKETELKEVERKIKWRASRLTSDKYNEIEKKAFRQSLYWLNRKREKLQSALKRLAKPSITFGSKKLQKQVDRGVKYQNEWAQARQNFTYTVGESDVVMGNNCIKFYPDNRLRIQVLDLNTFTLNLDEKALAPLKMQSLWGLSALDWIHLSKKRSIRLVERKTKHRTKLFMFITLDIEEQVEQPKERTYAGVDFNQGFLSYYIKPDTQGNIPYLHSTREKRYTSAQLSQSLRQAIQTLFKLCEAHHISHIRIESLNFNQKKRRLAKQRDLKYNFMLSQLPYSLYNKMITLEAFRHRRQIEYVNPAFTSQIAMMLGLDRHLGAARIIQIGDVNEATIQILTEQELHLAYQELNTEVNDEEIPY